MVVATGVYPTNLLYKIVFPAICPPDPKAEFKLDNIEVSYEELLTGTLPEIDTEPFLNSVI